MIINTFLDSISWLNSNAVGFLSFLLALLIALRTLGYFDKRQVEKELATVEEAYVSLIKSLDVFEAINQASGTWKRKVLDSLKENPKAYASLFESGAESASKIMEQNKNIFSELYDCQVRMELFLREEKYIKPIKDAITVKNSLEIFIKGLQSALSAVKEERDETLIRTYLVVIDATTVEIWDKVELSEEQKKAISTKPEYKNLKARISAIRSSSEVYYKWLNNRIAKVSNKKA